MFTCSLNHWMENQAVPGVKRKVSWNRFNMPHVRCCLWLRNRLNLQIWVTSIWGSLCLETFNRDFQCSYTEHYWECSITLLSSTSFTSPVCVKSYSIMIHIIRATWISFKVAKSYVPNHINRIFQCKFCLVLVSKYWSYFISFGREHTVSIQVTF